MMTKQHRNERGSALLLSIVVVVMVLGIGGAFLAEGIFRGKGQYAALEAEEALLMCDAGMEKARRALYVYASTKTWTWDEILAYSDSADAALIAEYNADKSPSPLVTTLSSQVIKYNYLKQIKNSTYTTYRSSLGDGDDSREAGLNTVDSALPASKTSWTTSDNVFLAGNSPYLKGSLHVSVRDNEDGDGSLLKDTDGRVLVIVSSTLPDGTQRQIEGLIEYKEVQFRMNAVAAVTANDDVDVLGNPTIDGRDWDINGARVVGPGVFGVVGVTSITNGGSASTGGNGNAPPNPSGVAANSQSPNHVFPGGYPPGPDEALGAPKGTLAELAKSQGTYFTSEAAYDTYINTTNGGVMPGGATIYCDFTPGSQFNLGTFGQPNVKPSILVIHTETLSGVIKQAHGAFKGALLADSIVRANGRTSVLGMVQTFSPTSANDGNVLGNGGGNFRFSSAALAELPSSKPDSAKLLSWRKLLQ